MKQKNLIIMCIAIIICIAIISIAAVTIPSNQNNNTTNETNLTINNTENNTNNTTTETTSKSSTKNSKDKKSSSDEEEYGTYINDEYVSMSEQEYAERYPALYHEESLQKGKYDKYHPDMYEVDRENGRI